MSEKLRPNVYSEEEAARVLGVSLSTLHRWRRNGIGPEYFRLGNILRYTKEALEEFREKHTKPAV